MNRFSATYSNNFATPFFGEKATHLGNVLNVITDRKIAVESTTTAGIVDHYEADVVSYSDYYPFGMQMPGRHGSSADYRYGFNGMEKDDEVKGEGNSYDFGARLLDVRLGRWLSRDPMAGKYPHLSPYCFVANSPIQYIDPDGRVIKVVGKESQDRLMSVLYAAFGENAQYFSFDENNHLTMSVDGDLLFKGSEYEVYEGLNKVMTHEAVLEVSFETNDLVVAKGGEVTKIDDKGGKINSATTQIDPSENYGINVKGLVDMYESTDGILRENANHTNVKKDINGDAVFAKKAVGSIKETTSSVKARFFHAIGHFNFELEGDKNQYKVNRFENIARSIFKEYKQTRKEKKNNEEGHYESKKEKPRSEEDDTHKSH